MNYFPKNNEEISLIKFLAKYQYVNVNDLNYFFKSKKYYKTRITNLINKKLIKRINHNLVLTKHGRDYIKSIGLSCNKLNRNERYLPRLYYISNLGAFYHNNELVTFTPSFDLKDKMILTTTSRRYIGIININGIDYLTYHISKDHDKKYVSSVIYDIQKEKQFKNILILLDSGVKINNLDFTFGYNQVLILEDTIENRNKLPYINSINWHKIASHFFKNPYISEYNFCDYIDIKNRYIAYFTLFDTEKTNRINQYLRENKFKRIEVLCPKELYSKLRQEILRANYTVLNLANFIDKKRNIYE